MLTGRVSRTAVLSLVQEHFRLRAGFRRSFVATGMIVSTRSSFQRCCDSALIVVGKFVSKETLLLELQRLIQPRPKPPDLRPCQSASSIKSTTRIVIISLP